MYCGNWVETYPHKVWTNILVLDNKMIDYKIGGRKEDKGSWSLIWDEELIKRFDEIEVISFYEEVNNSEEHNRAFDNGRDKVNEHVEKYGKYIQW